MKKIFALVLMLSAFSLALAGNPGKTDTATFYNTYRAPTYISGDIVRDSARTYHTDTTGGSHLVVDAWSASKINCSFVVKYTSDQGNAPLLYGYVTNVGLSVDTAIVNGFDVSVYLLSDTTGLGAALAKDNDVFQLASTFQGKIIGSKPISIHLDSDGTTAAGAGLTTGAADGIIYPFDWNGLTTADRHSVTIYGIVVMKSTTTLKFHGKFFARIGIEVG